MVHPSTLFEDVCVQNETRKYLELINYKTCRPLKCILTNDARQRGLIPQYSSKAHLSECYKAFFEKQCSRNSFEPYLKLHRTVSKFNHRFYLNYLQSLLVSFHYWNQVLKGHRVLKSLAGRSQLTRIGYHTRHRALLSIRFVGGSDGTT